MNNFLLPPAPISQTGEVKAWQEPVVLPTHEPLPPDRNPMFLERRVYQGSSGKVYPLPFTDRIASDPQPRAWTALHIENSFLRLMVLPEIGGRIHVGFDKTNGYDFFYRQNVIKPALVGLAGPWISGGVEFNWPQHHRPATFMPTSYEIEEHPDGSRTIWCGDHDPMNRLRGMHGVCLHPDQALVHLKVRLYNRTPLTHTFLWWANVGVRVHEQYQSFFPPDVHFVADHARRAMSTFPLCDGHYYGIDYAARSRNGIPAEEQPSRFIPPGNYPPNDLSWYANIPVPTSYMAVGSQEDFVGGYDHARQAGLVHIANRHISPGKKQWTWGNHDFGYAWDRNLTDSDGPYIELMAGVYTDNQPDFSFLAPGEGRTFSQYWFPIKAIGPPQKANTELAISFTSAEDSVRIGIYATQESRNSSIALTLGDDILAEWTRDLAPATATFLDCPLPANYIAHELRLTVKKVNGYELISYQPEAPSKREAPAAAEAPLLPEQIKSNEDLYLTGLHLDQYRHATRLPETYWREALRRDPNDARSNNAMGLWHLRRYEFKLAESHFRRANATLTRSNSNPYDGEAFYYLGVTLRWQGEFEQAYAAFYKATWNYAWRSPSFLALAEINALNGRWSQALHHCHLCLRSNPDHLNARNLSVLLLRQLNKPEEAKKQLAETLTLDLLDPWAKHLSGLEFPGNNQTRLDIAFDCMRAGFYQEAIAILREANHSANDGSVPMVLYTLAFCSAKGGNLAASSEWLKLAAKARADYCFPNRAEEMLILEFAISAEGGDARASYYLGNLLYDRRRHREAILSWEKAAESEPVLPTLWRNLGIAFFNVLQDTRAAARAFDRAFSADVSSARVLFERDQLWKRTGAPPETRLQELELYPNLTLQRDDLSVEMAALYNQTGNPAKALALLNSRNFQPWEGGEGFALSQYVRAHLTLGRQALEEHRAAVAVSHFQSARVTPGHLGEASHPLANRSNIYYWLGNACHANGELAAANTWWRKAESTKGDFVNVAVEVYSEMTYYRAMAMLHLGEEAAARTLLEKVQLYAKQLSHRKAEVDYFATSLPAMLLFNDDLDRRNKIRAYFLEAQAKLGLGEEKQARRLLAKVLKLDPNHPMAQDFRDEIPCQQRLRSSILVEA